MSEESTPKTAALVQCTFCAFPNIVNSDEAEPLCINCKLELSRLKPAGTEADGDADAASTSEPHLEEAEPLEALFGGRASQMEDRAEATPAAALSAGLRGAASQPADPGATIAQRGKRRSRAPWIISGAFAVLIAGAGVATWAILSSTPATVATAAAPETTVDLAGWSATPAWTLDVRAEATAESPDGATLIIATSDVASIVDAETGATITTQPLSGDATPGTYWVGDIALVTDGDTLHLWKHATQIPRGDDDADDTGDAGTWATTEFGDATLALRGDMAFAVAEVGAEYEVVNADATRDKVTVPTKGAVPVAADGDTVTWGTNKGVAYITGRDGSDSRDVTLQAPSETATVSRWVGGDSDHVYVVWSDGDTDTAAVHSVKNGDTISSHPLKADRNTAATSTRDGAHVAYAGLLIDATTGAITETSHDITGAAGDWFLTAEPVELVNPDGGTTPLVGQDVTPIALSPNGDLIVDTGDELAALTETAGNEGAQQP